MSTVQLQNDSSTLVLNEHIFTDLAEGDTITLSFPNASTFRVNSNKGVTVGNRSDGVVADMVVRVAKYGDDDIFLQNAMNQTTPVLFNGSLKESYNLNGGAFESSYLLEIGSITGKPSDARNTQDGNAVMEYTIQFRRATRTL